MIPQIADTDPDPIIRDGRSCWSTGLDTRLCFCADCDSLAHHHDREAFDLDADRVPETQHFHIREIANGR